MFLISEIMIKYNIFSFLSSPQTLPYTSLTNITWKASHYLAHLSSALSLGLPKCVSAVATQWQLSATGPHYHLSKDRMYSTSGSGNQG